MADRIAHGAIHDAEGLREARCLGETRAAILDEILNWVDGPPLGSQILWLEGPAGAGKTAIAGTVCERLKSKGRLGGDYFIRIGNGGALPLFATIAYQLVDIPAVGERVETVIANNPAIIFRAVDDQLQKLIVDPLLVLQKDTPPYVILIDGLDECASESKQPRDNESLQCRIIRLIGSVCKDHHPPVRFIISSRPERWIRDEFASESISRTLHHVSLERTDQTDQDIRLVYISGFQEIRESANHKAKMSDMPTTWTWVSEQDLKTLVDNASGQFSYADTVLKFIGDPNGQPSARLQIILEIPIAPTTSNPFAALDLLYSKIISLLPNKELTMDVLGAILVMTSTIGSDPILARESLEIAFRLLGLPPDEDYASLRTLHSLLRVPDPIGKRRENMTVDEYRTWLGEGSGVKFHHKSFPDFLGDKNRSGDFCVDNNLIHSRLALGCLKVLKGLSSKPESRLHYSKALVSISVACSY